MPLGEAPLRRYEYGDGEVLIYREPSRQVRAGAFVRITTFWREAGENLEALYKMAEFQKVFDEYRALLIASVEGYERKGGEAEDIEEVRAELTEGKDPVTEEALGSLCRELFFRPAIAVLSNEGSGA